MKKYFMILAAALLTFAACNKDDDKSEDKNILEYGGVKYKTVTLSNGQTWMAEPLRYLPEGAKVSDDPASEGIVYAYKFKNVVIGKNDKGVDAIDSYEYDMATSEAAIKELGYLYDFKSIFGADITEDNYNKLEGVQGICPAGWHIPTHAECLALVGNSNALVTGETAPSDKNALFYDEAYDGARYVNMIKEFNFPLSGYAMAGKYGIIPLSRLSTTVESLYNYNSPFNFIVTSTGYKPKTGVQLFGMQTTFNTTKYPEGRVTLGYITNNKTKVQVRCVKDSEKK